MKKKLLLCLLVAAAPILSFAQGALTIFSEDGDRFYLVLNGQKQNPTPQTNVRVDGLTSQYYSAKILFEDASKPEISKNIPVTDPGTSNFADVTYKIKRTKDGELKIRYFSANPVPVSYNPPPDMYYMHYGQVAPPPPPPPSGGTVVTHTTTTTTSTTGDVDGASVNMNVGGAGLSMSVGAGGTGAGVSMNVGAGGRGAGVNMNINVSDPNTTVQTTRTTTTTHVTSSSTSYDNGTYAAPPPPATRGGCGYPMAAGDFSSALHTINGSSFDETKLSTAKTIVGPSNCVSTNQVIEICKQFSFEDNKVEFAKYAYDYTTDRNNYFKVANIFTFDSNKTELNDFISSRR